MITARKQHTPSPRGILLFLLILPIIGALFTPAPARAQAAQLPIYIVKSGDTLYGIAGQFFTTIDEILAVNNRTIGDTLHPGDRLFIPGLQGLQGVLTTDFVPLGASLRSLSRRTQSDMASLVRLNKFTSQSELFVGRKISLTTSEATQDLRTMPSLLPGQSWLELAILTGENPWSLARLNRLTSPNDALPQDAYYAHSSQNSPNSLAIPGITSLVIDNLPLVQGGTFVLKVTSEKPVTLSADLAGVQPVFFTQEDGSQIAFGGIHALLEPGAYPLTIEVTDTNGTSYRFDQWTIVGSGNFEVDETLKVDPETVDGDNIASEDALFKQIVTTLSPKQLWNGMFQYPTKGGDCVNSRFGSRRTYSGTEKVYYHTGLDIGWCYGIDVFAPAAGTVVAALPNQIVRGNTIVIDHGLGVFSIYMHLQDMLVAEGDQVEPGQLIAHIGNTGRSNGPHLHFEIDINGTPVNPVTWLNREFP
jgi:murein DD-endopeptidase MepM/ murein hydrolase activator NlpD